MANIQAGSIKNGTIFMYDGNIFKVIEFQHVKPGKGPAFVRTKLRNVRTGAIIEKTLNPAEKVEEIELSIRKMEYIYEADDLYYLMDKETYEQLGMTETQMSDALKYIKENMEVTVVSYEGEILEVRPPMFVILEVKYTEPGFAGNTATTSGKPATLENDLVVSVPLFVKIGDKVKVDTRTGNYVERV